MAGTLFIPPSKALDANADPYAGAKWFFYATGTTTPQTVYTTFARNVAHSSPVVADSSGKFANIFFDPALVYRAVLKNADESVTLHDIDPVSDTTLATLADDTGASFVGFLQTGTGATARTAQDKMRDVISAKDFGVVGDNSADDTTKLQAAIDAAIAARKALYIPAHAVGAAYKITAPLTVSGPLNIIGEHPDYCTIFATGMLANNYILDINLAAATNNYFGLENVTIRSNNGLPDGARLKNVSYLLWDNVQVYGVRDAYSIEGTICFSNTFRNVTTYQISRYGAYFKAFAGGGHYKFDSCTFAGDTGFFVDNTSNITQLTLDACNFEQCVTESLRMEGTVKGISIDGARTEGCGGNDFVFIPDAGKIISGLSITGSFFSSDAAASYPIVLGGYTGAIRGFSFTGNHVENNTANFVLLNGEGESGLIAGNRFETATCTPTNTTRAGVIVFANENTAGKCAEAWGTRTLFTGHTGTVVYDPANLVDGAGVTTTVTVTGAAVGDVAIASFSNDLQGIMLTAYVSATNTVSVRFQNETTGAIDLASGTIRATVFKA